jgi:hemoglobin
MLCLLLVAFAANAQDKKDVEKEVATFLEATVKEGARMWNNDKNYAGTLKLYEDALTKVAKQLDGKPELVKIINDKFAKARTQPAVTDKAFTLREAIDATYLSLGSKPLWDRLGGEPAVRAVVGKFIVKAATNPKVNFFRDGAFKFTDADVKKLEQLLVELISQVSGGPLKYTGRSMKDTHKGMGITEDEFGAIANDLIATLKKFKVPQKEIDELVGIVAGTKGDIVEKK